jgi:hypothetical protein
VIHSASAHRNEIAAMKAAWSLLLRHELQLALIALALGARPAHAESPAASPASLQLDPAFFPPVPPPLGTPLPAATPKTRPKAPVPAEFAAFANEPFYAPLGARLAQNDLSPELHRDLESYQEARSALLLELRAQLDALKEASADTRASTLAAFAREQTPRIAKLEMTAEQLRAALAQSEPAREGSDARGPEPVPANAASHPSQILRAAYYQAGLSAAQRRLLREIAIELMEGATPPVAAPGNAGPILFFSPETTRIRWPAQLPGALAAKVADYEKRKAALKKELCDALNEADAASGAPHAAPAWVALAEQQAPRIDALEQLAEEIRRGLALLPDRPPALSTLTLPSLTPEVEAQVVAYRREKFALQKALLARVDEVAKSTAAPRDRSKPGISAAPTEADERIRQAIAAFQRENAARYAAVEKMKEVVRSELARLAGSGAIVVTGPFADVLSKNFSEALQQLETWRHYREYQIAVYEPGLSPEQRRLLFGAAVEKLALPQPMGAPPPN